MRDWVRVRRGSQVLCRTALFWFRNTEPSWLTGRRKQRAQYRKELRSNCGSTSFYVASCPVELASCAELNNLNVCSASNKAGIRGGTRIPCEIPVTLTSLDTAQPFADQCLVILVNPQGCAVRFRLPLPLGATVRLDGLPASTSITARVVNCISLGQYEKLWLLGLALDEPGNVWGIQSPPEDWMQ